MNIFIGISLSRKNSKFLDKLLKSLINLEVPSNYSLKIIFIAEKKNFNFFNIISKKLSNKNFEVLFVHEKGIPQSRNMFLKFLRNNNSKYAGFLDDDCIIPMNWLKNMVKFIEKNNCDVVGGPQLHKVQNQFYKRLFTLIEPKRYHGQKVDWVATNNVFFKSKSIINKNFFFDKNLKNIGGSDQLFFKKLHSKKLKYKWNLNSRVIENIQPDRESFKWFVRRNMRYGYSGSYIDRVIYGSILGSFVSLIKAFYMFLVSVFLLLTFFIKNNFYKSIFYFFRSVGRLSNFIGYTPKKYM